MIKRWRVKTSDTRFLMLPPHSSSSYKNATDEAVDDTSLDGTFSRRRRRRRWRRSIAEHDKLIDSNAKVANEKGDASVHLSKFRLEMEDDFALRRFGRRDYRLQKRNQKCLHLAVQGTRARAFTIYTYRTTFV